MSDLSKEQKDELVTSYAALALYDGDVSVLLDENWRVDGWMDGWRPCSAPASLTVPASLPCLPCLLTMDGLLPPCSPQTHSHHTITMIT